MVVAYGAKISKLLAVEGGYIELFWGACTTTQRGDGRLRFPLGPLTPAGKREEKSKENEGKSLKTGGNGWKMEEDGGMAGHYARGGRNQTEIIHKLGCG